jgi:diguanylate cyclase (GGDEF)-like protein/PAS domain S-box-containing protein
MHLLPDRRHLWWIYLACGLVAIGLYVAVPPLMGSGPVYDAIGLSGVLAFAAGRRLNRPGTAWAWRLLLAGLALQWLGDLYGYSLWHLFGPTQPAMSPADVPYLLMYPAMLAGLLALIRRRNRTTGGPGLIDALVMTLGLGLIAGTVLIDPYVHNHTMRLAPKLVAIAYPAGDIVLLAAGLRLALDAGSRRLSFHLLIAGLVVLLTTDFIYGVMSLNGTFHDQLSLDVGWLLLYLLWGAAALHPSMRELSQPAPARASRVSALRLVLLAGSSLVAPVLEVIKAIGWGNFDAVLIACSSVALFLLVIGRMAGLVRQRESAATRERTLTDAGHRLVAASSPREIAGAALQAAAVLAAGPAQARLCESDADGLMVSALQGGRVSRWLAEDDALAGYLAEAGDHTRHTMDETVRATLRFAAEPAETIVIEVSPGQEHASWLLLAGARVDGGETRAALRSLASQVALARERSQLGETIHRQQSDARLSTLVQNSSDLITTLDASATVTYQSPSIESILGYHPDEVIGKPFETLLHPNENGRFLLRLTESALMAPSRPEPIECLLAHKNGSLRHFEILHSTLVDDNGIQGIILNARDVSERKAFEEQLAHQAFHDPVTLLANRALFNERTRHAVARGLREQIGLATIFVDLDDFKTVNDSLGHAAGDSVLVEVAQRISSSVRAADTAARFGGDEFAILLEDVEDIQTAAETAQRILEALARPIEIEGNPLAIRASLGISFAPAGTATGADELVRNADAAMYIAKGDGKGGYRIFEPEMHERVLERLQLRADLERALDNDEFVLHYQPLVRLQNDEISGVEALLRWMHPTRGMVSPDQFIPLAEETGLIVPIGRWVLQEGCRQARDLRRRFPSDAPPSISINLSVKQLFSPDIVADVAGALAGAELQPGALTLEITESVMMNDIELATARLSELHGLGVRLAMDDFGTGYSSLSYLTRFPIDVLKMDRSLLAAGAGGGRGLFSGLATAVLGLGETFDLEVVAEGIEYAEQADTLRALGCEIGQGFFFARPMPSADLVEFLAGWSPSRDPAHA